ncbi:hypothetical protein KSP39_PZI003396 [Platanthera zijinensis]|uniref:Uncharacterized protein n=1 Tax=Platanthera zijinensis TaxID=2320716 RepID=A0AAP0BWS2_9ASPA
MERSEPTFVPEWYKVTSSSTATGNSNSNHHGGSLHSADEHTGGFSSRNRLPLSVCDHDAPRPLPFSDRTSPAFLRSASSNGSMGWEKEFPSRGFNSFGRSHRDRERDRERDLDFRERERLLLLDNGFSNYPDSLTNNTYEKDFLRRSQSLASGRRVEPWLKKSGHDSSNAILSAGSVVSGITKSSFERDFPSLGAEEKHLGSDLTRVASLNLGTAIDILPLSASAIIGSDGWTSALAEVPPIAGLNGQGISSSLQTSHAPISSSTTAGLNMAETLAQAPGRVLTVPKLSSDSQKIEDLHRQQILKLRPVTSTMLKNTGPNTADKSKTKGSKIVDFSSIKQQSSSHFVSHTSVRSETPKISLPGQFQVLNRERNGFSPAAKDFLSSTNISRVPTSSGDPKGGASTLRACVEKKIPSQTQKRNDFFNSLRKKTSPSQLGNAADDLSCDISSSNAQKAGKLIAADSTSAKPPSSSLNSNSAENGNCFSGGCCALEEPEKLVPDEEEAAFLRSLGWEENAGEEALTREEIESFLSEVIISFYYA